MSALKRVGTRVRADECGFTLPEVLIVCVVLGILAAIALAQFLGNSRKADDADAKSNARSLQAQVESCFTDAQDFGSCTGSGPADQLGSNLGLPMGSSAGEVHVSATTQSTYEITAVSKASSGGANHRFMLSRDPVGRVQHTCVAGPTNSDGGCHGGFW
ncbi:MAG TPA: type II secretion system protein [Thermoleophilaceae bacterium]